MKLASLLLAAFGFLTLSTWAADAPAEPKTLLAERGKLLWSDDLNAARTAEWKAPKGAWDAADGAVRGAEKPEDHHGAVIRHSIAFQNAVIQYSFKLDGAKATSFSINDAKGHLARVAINPAGFTVQKDDSDHEGPDKAVIFQKVAVPIKAGEWHTVVIEIVGQEMLASLDGKKVGFGEHARIGDAKANIGLTVSGQTASFKGLRIWDAQANKDWPATKAGLSARTASK